MTVEFMADMAGVGVLDLAVLKTHAYPLDGVNDALSEVKTRPGGLVNIVVNPGILPENKKGIIE
jgi:hypothetical protein